jgi:hypothetical protein
MKFLKNKRNIFGFDLRFVANAYSPASLHDIIHLTDNRQFVYIISKHIILLTCQ